MKKITAEIADRIEEMVRLPHSGLKGVQKAIKAEFGVTIPVKDLTSLVRSFTIAGVFED